MRGVERVTHKTIVTPHIEHDYGSVNSIEDPKLVKLGKANKLYAQM